MARTLWSRIADDLRRFHEGGGAGHWLSSVTPLNTISELRTVQNRARPALDIDAVPDAIKEAIEEAIEHVERAQRAPALALFGFSKDAKHSKTAREDEAAVASNLTYGSTYRRPAKRLSQGTRERSPLDVTIELVARALADLEREALADDEATGLPPNQLGDRPSLDELAAAWRSLPPFSVAELKSLQATKLDQELRTVLAHLYHSFHRLRERRTFVSWTSALDLRMHHDDPDDCVYVIARRDSASTPGFQQQEHWDPYVTWLRHRVRPIGPPTILREVGREHTGINQGTEPGINHVRIVIANDHDSALERTSEIRSLHRSGTLFYLPSAQLRKYEYLCNLKFGLLISTRHRYAMVSVPMSSSLHILGARDISTFVEECNRYDPLAGEMRAVVTADAQYIKNLVHDFNAILASPDAVCLPSGDSVAPDGKAGS